MTQSFPRERSSHKSTSAVRTTAFLLLAAAALTSAARAATAFQAEAGASYYFLRDARLEGAPTPLSTDEPGKLAPFIAGSLAFNERVALRVSYAYLDHARSTAMFPGPPNSPLTVVVWGHYRDDVHVVSVAPEFTWALGPRLAFAVAPQVNWVASRGVVSYSTNSALILLVGPQARHDDGFTLGGAAKLRWTLGARSALSLGYEHVDLAPSFGRRAHVLSGGWRWKF